jgi:hypothetical protein
MPEAADGVARGEEQVAKVTSIGFHEGMWKTRVFEV